MSAFVRYGKEDRRTAVTEGAARLGILPLIAEKDYWVCWLLGRLFEDDDLKEHVVFKGGTTLSKVFGVIDRFSEDIDLSVSPETLGFKEAELDLAPSKTKRNKLFQRLQESCAEYVQNEFQKRLETIAQDTLGARTGRKPWFSFQEDARTHSPVLFFEYPSTLPRERGYIEQAVKLEFGSLTDQRPTGTHPIRPLLSEVIPDMAEESENVVAMEVERTFWEKATILHAEHHRPADRPSPDRFARHYSDFAALWRHPVKDAAVKQLDLLERVATFKSRFFASGWVDYDTARPPTLKLSPASSHEAELQRDYEEMRPLFMTDPPAFPEILETIANAERNING